MLRLLSKNPEGRPSTARAVGEALTEIQESSASCLPVSPQRSPQLRPVNPSGGSRRRWALAALAVGLLGVAALAWRLSHEPNTPGQAAPPPDSTPKAPAAYP